MHYKTRDKIISGVQSFATAGVVVLSLSYVYNDDNLEPRTAKPATHASLAECLQGKAPINQRGCYNASLGL